MTAAFANFWSMTRGEAALNHHLRKARHWYLANFILLRSAACQANKKIWIKIPRGVYEGMRTRSAGGSAEPGRGGGHRRGGREDWGTPLGRLDRCFAVAQRSVHLRGLEDVLHDDEELVQLWHPALHSAACIMLLFFLML